MIYIINNIGQNTGHLRVTDPDFDPDLNSSQNTGHEPYLNCI
jgi:hypothetical protein